uniref:Transcriptional regulator n=1 Tax=Steinernema glaseri TaxID=37863 RepID=A0A1I7YYD9_9BILA
MSSEVLRASQEGHAENVLVCDNKIGDEKRLKEMSEESGLLFKSVT